MSIVTPERPVDASGAPTPSRPRRSWWHAFNGVLALGAIIIGVIALTRDPATKTVEVASPAPAAAPSNWVGDPGPVLGLPSEGATRVEAQANVATWQLMPSGWPATVAMRQAAESASGFPAGGFPSDKYADRVPAYQYDIAKEHAPVSPVSPRTPDPTKTIVRR